MKYVVSVHYRHGWLDLSSPSTGLRASGSTLTGVARTSPRSPELIESVGKTPSELYELSDQTASLMNDFRKNSLRFFDPLLEDTFDPRVGAAIIGYYQYLAFSSSARWFQLRAAFWIDWISYRVDVQGFGSLAGALQKRFKKELRRLPGCWSVIVSDYVSPADMSR
jgi:hypothetical protein